MKGEGEGEGGCAGGGLLERVLVSKDLCKAGDLFSVSNWDVVSNLHSVLARLKDLVHSPHYHTSPNDQSVAEISLTRITAAIRETNTIETYAASLVDVLQTTLSHVTSPDPLSPDHLTPHAKIASDLLACLFLEQYNNCCVMRLSIPVGMRVLGCGNPELTRAISSYLALAVINNARLLANYAQTIIKSVTLNGNLSLIRVLPQIYPENKEPFNASISQLVALLASSDTPEKLCLLQLFLTMTKSKPQLIIPYVNKLKSSLYDGSTSLAVVSIYGELVTSGHANVLADQMESLKKTGHLHPETVHAIAPLMGAIGATEKSLAQEAAGYFVNEFYRADCGLLVAFAREIQVLATSYPDVVYPYLHEIQRWTDTGGPAFKAHATNIQYLCRSANLTPCFSDERITVIAVNCASCSQEDVGGLHDASSRASSHSLIAPYGKALSMGSGSKDGSMRQISGGKSRTPPKIHTYRVTDDTLGEKYVYFTPSGRARMISARTPETLSRRKSKSVNNLSSNHRLKHCCPQMCHAPAVESRVPADPVSHPAANRDTPASAVGQSASPMFARPTNQDTPTSAAGQSASPMFVRPTNQDSAARNRAALMEIRRGVNAYCKPNVTSVTPYVNDTSRQSQPVTTASPKCGGKMETTFGRDRITVQRDVMEQLGACWGEQSPCFPQRTPLGAVNSCPRATVLHLSATSSVNSSQILHEGGISHDTNCDDRGVSALPRMVSVATQSTATLNSKLGTDEKSSAQSPFSNQPHIGLPRGGDAVRQFCEKHLDKIRRYMQDLTNRYPVPNQCTVEEMKGKDRLRVHFLCQVGLEHCLHKATSFAFKTKLPNIWLHLMFLQIQAQSERALSQTDASVGRLKHCWETLPPSITRRSSFSALVTSAFPNFKDQELVLRELQLTRYFDMFAYNGALRKWACFACNHPEHVTTLLQRQGSIPVLEGQLKEKKGRWRFLKRWRTRYFTLSGAALSYRGDDTLSCTGSPRIYLRSIRSVKSVSNRRSKRTIPKAFEIFTEDHCSFVLKAKDHKNCEEWFQCLQIAVAQAQKEKTVSVV